MSDELVVTIIVKDGCVIDALVPDGVRVIVKDYDVQDADPDHLRDDRGPFTQDEWTHRRLKSPGCEHQHEGEPHCQPAFLNSYHCDACDVSWEDQHSCGCDDECPECGTAISPETSEVIAACACESL
ncbi:MULTISPECIES: hypothetical protein [Bradyrhizobium]|uniref:hypothetical protein n=1 Tax=Bradyrhizobium TaxID=374 RepID=UPI001409C079|nr:MULTISPECIES: hypothetical protein [Bradyrhizobium]MCK7669137.1 hypothetical protein [Bradyrhizobium sp. 2S1]UGY23795.1 hypothetical protein HU675_0038590 [Bradyrhizobium septentrionale]